MSIINLAPHEQYLKSLESSLKEICDYHHQAITTMKQSWDLTLELFLVADDLREAWIALEKEEQ